MSGEGSKEMEGERGDPFGSIMKFLPRIESLESQIRNASFAREFDDFSDSLPQQYFSPGPTEVGTSEIIMLSLPDSVPSDRNPGEEDPLFETPPENPLQHSSSEDRNEDVEVVDLEDEGIDSKRVSESGMDDKREPKKRALGDAQGDKEEGEGVSTRYVLPRPMNPEGITLLDILDDIQAYFARKRGGVDEDSVNIVETAKKQGMTFPRPRWWPPEDN